MRRHESAVGNLVLAYGGPEPRPPPSLRPRPGAVLSPAATRGQHRLREARKEGGKGGRREEGNVCYGCHRNGAGPSDSRPRPGFPPSTPSHHRGWGGWRAGGHQRRSKEGLLSRKAGVNPSLACSPHSVHAQHPPSHSPPGPALLPRGHSSRAHTHKFHGSQICPPPTQRRQGSQVVCRACMPALGGGSSSRACSMCPPTHTEAHTLFAGLLWSPSDLLPPEHRQLGTQ